MAEQVVAPKKVGTKKTEAIIGTGVKNLESALKQLENAAKNFNKLNEAVQTLSLEIVDKETKISELEVTFKERQRQLQVDLEVSVKENINSVITAHFNEYGKTVVDNVEYQNLLAERAALKAEFKSEVAKEVAITKASITREYEFNVKIEQAKHDQQRAEDAARIKSLDEKVAFLTTEVERMYKQLDSERSAGTERAKAAAIGSVNVTSGK